MNQIPNKISTNEYAIIKLKKFNDFEVAIMADKKNGGITISYDDSGLNPEDRRGVMAEIETIISGEMSKIIEEET
jgi:hypothetical protein